MTADMADDVIIVAGFGSAAFVMAFGWVLIFAEARERRLSEPGIRLLMLSVAMMCADLAVLVLLAIPVVGPAQPLLVGSLVGVVAALFLYGALRYRVRGGR